jgi:putative flippase GtrA
MSVRPFWGFVLVGAVGFVVHTGGVTVLMVDHDVSPIAAWGLAFAMAVSLTWILNRTLVFRVGQPQRVGMSVEYARYVFIQVGGALLSLVIFGALLAIYPSLVDTPVIAVAAGAVVALLFNYAGARWWVFDGADGTPP